MQTLVEWNGMEWNVFYTDTDTQCHVHIACIEKPDTSSMNFNNWKLLFNVLNKWRALVFAP